jgi:hypothetical protein
VVREEAPAPIQTLVQPMPIVRSAVCGSEVGTAEAARDGAGGVRVRAADRSDVSLVSAMPFKEGGLVLLLAGDGPIDVGAARLCTTREGMLAVRLDRAGNVVWARYLAVPASKVVAAIDGSWIWIARVTQLAPASERLPGDVRPLIVVDRLSFDGTYFDSRVVATWRTDGVRDQGAHVMETAKLARAAADFGILYLAGTSDHGRMVGGRWQVDDTSSVQTGFVLAIAWWGPIESVVAEDGYVVEDLGVAVDHFVMAGWCASAGSSICPAVSTASIVVYGPLSRVDTHKRHRVNLGRSLAKVHTAINDKGEILVASTSWEKEAVVEGVELHSTCARFAYVASWTDEGDLLFARPLGDCTQFHDSPFGVDGEAPDGRVSGHQLEAIDVAFIDYQPVVTVRVEPEGDRRAWPVRFDGTRVSTPFASAAIVLPLDAVGRIVRPRVVNAVRRLEQGTDTDPRYDVVGDGVSSVAVLWCRGLTWLTVQHQGSVNVQWRPYDTWSGAERAIELVRW